MSTHRTSEKLQKTETNYSISCRWKKDDQVYKDHLMHYLTDQMSELEKQLQVATKHRLFLLLQKKKYAGKLNCGLSHYNLHYIDGQKIAKKLSKQISKVTSTIKETLHQYNNLSAHTGKTVLSLDVPNPDSNMWVICRLADLQHVIPDLPSSVFMK